MSFFFNSACFPEKHIDWKRSTFPLVERVYLYKSKRRVRESKWGGLSCVPSEQAPGAEVPQLHWQWSVLWPQDPDMGRRGRTAHSEVQPELPNCSSRAKKGMNWSVHSSGHTVEQKGKKWHKNIHNDSILLVISPSELSTSVVLEIYNFNIKRAE